jgi:hypothetical protein
MPPITDGPSLFATSSTPYIVAVACASVACSPFRTRRRCMGFTSFPSVSVRLAGRAMGLGTFYPPHSLGNPVQYMTCTGRSGAFWLQLPGLRRETSVSCLMLTTVQSNVHMCFPYPLPQHSSTDLFSRLDSPCRLLARLSLWPFAQNVYPQLRTSRLLMTHVQSRSLRSGSGFSWMETRHAEWCRVCA